MADSCLSGLLTCASSNILNNSYIACENGLQGERNICSLLTAPSTSLPFVIYITVLITLPLYLLFALKLVVLV